MSSLQLKLKKLKFDRRLIAQSIKNGQLTQEEYESYLKSLEDCSARSKQLKIYDEGSNGAAN